MDVFSVGIMAYNEKENIENVLKAVLAQDVGPEWEMVRILVVSSGSDDGTDEAIKRIAQTDSRIELIRQNQRLGKCSAINLFLEKSPCDLCIFVNADTVPAKGSFRILLETKSPETGMIGSRPVPVNKGNSLADHCVRFLWLMHHHVSLISPKIGEMFVFNRQVDASLPANSAVDEAVFEATCIARGKKLVYQPKAVVYLKGPTRLREYLSQRRRIAFGHVWVRANYHYTVSTMFVFRILRALPKALANPQTKFLPAMLCMLLELFSRTLGRIDMLCGREDKHSVWKVADTSKGSIDVS